MTSVGPGGFRTGQPAAVRGSAHDMQTPAGLEAGHLLHVLSAHLLPVQPAGVAAPHRHPQAQDPKIPHEPNQPAEQPVVCNLCCRRHKPLSFQGCGPVPNLRHRATIQCRQGGWANGRRHGLDTTEQQLRLSQHVHALIPRLLGCNACDDACPPRLPNPSRHKRTPWPEANQFACTCAADSAVCITTWDSRAGAGIPQTGTLRLNPAPRWLRLSRRPLRRRSWVALRPFTWLFSKNGQALNES
jgi:hypothetical protein